MIESTSQMMPEAESRIVSNTEEQTTAPDLKLVSNATGKHGERSVRIEIPITTMLRVLEHRQLSAAEFRCLDAQSKKQIWNLCLKACFADCIASHS